MLIVCSTGVGALLWFPIKFGNAPFPSGAIALRLGADASAIVVFAPAFAELDFITIGFASSFVAEALSVAAGEGEGLGESASLLLLG
jgi:hypothetical protein